MKSTIALLFIAGISFHLVLGQQPASNGIILGAERTDQYVRYLAGKQVAIVANPTSTIGNKHLVDTLLNLGINVKKVFGPEHGFRGTAINGEYVSNEVDQKTGLPIISLYGRQKKPTQENLKDVDIVIFDIQDVGCRFYTYINLLRDVMEACATNGKEILVLDRPNPNGYLVDGPILDMNLKSGIGQFPIPIAHGMTIAEFAQMIIGEQWMANSSQCKLTIVPLLNYHHEMPYDPPISPSPNLNTSLSILLYPSTCLFEGTILNHGRGTLFPFTVLGSPAYEGVFPFQYTPKKIVGMSTAPLFKNQICYGMVLRDTDVEELRKSKKLNLEWLIQLYRAHPDQANFFNQKLSNQIGSIDLLAGTKTFKEQIHSKISIAEIRASWEPALSQYKAMREKYLLYP